ncbi:MAG: GMC family oxidoreductase [Deltaproteobacteria bacterium]|nr:GMC family oxidoreductase [Deltaproteobacteria bacterium]
MPTYDAVIVGSGFGGAVAAERIAKAGKSVVVLERGPRWAYSNVHKTSSRNADGSIKPGADGLYRFEHAHDPRYIYSSFKDYLAPNLLVANTFGVGGGSLWYSNISERAPSRIFSGSPAWPAAWNYTRLSDLYTRVEGVYDAGTDTWTTPYKVYNHVPTHKPPRYNILRYAIEQVAGAGAFPHARVAVRGKGSACANYCQGRCRYCGFCTFGCINGAKQSMMMNYLYRAEYHGAQVWSQKYVVRVENRADGMYDVVYKDASFGHFLDGVKATGATEYRVTAKVVVLAGGAIATPELLLKSVSAGYLVNVSGQVGRNMSGTGDYASGLYLPSGFSIGYDGCTYTSTEAFKGRVIVGITRNLAASDGVVIEDLWGPPVGLAAKFAARLHDPSWADSSSYWNSTTNKVTKWKNPSLYGLRQKQLVEAYPKRAIGIAFMGEDGNDGRISLDGSGNVAITRPTLTKYDTYQWWLNEIRKKLPANTRFVETEHERRNGDFFASVHLLGTCRMSDSATTGVCNANGQVFNYPNLYVCDGSVVPRSTIVNPSWTILAVSEGISDYIVTNFPA